MYFSNEDLKSQSVLMHVTYFFMHVNFSIIGFAHCSVSVQFCSCTAKCTYVAHILWADGLLSRTSLHQEQKGFFFPLATYFSLKPFYFVMKSSAIVTKDWFPFWYFSLNLHEMKLMSFYVECKYLYQIYKKWKSRWHQFLTFLSTPYKI